MTKPKSIINEIISVNGKSFDEHLKDMATERNKNERSFVLSEEEIETLSEEEIPSNTSNQPIEDKTENDGHALAEEPEDESENSGKQTPETGAYLVCKGAICKCAVGTTPARLKITSHNKYYVNDKLVATVKDVNFEEPAFGSCTVKNNAKCKPQGTAWEILASEEHPEAGGHKVLTENGKLNCTAGPGLIEIIAHGQIQSVSSADTEDYSVGIASAVNCLAEIEDIIEEKKDEQKAAPVSTLILSGQEARSNPNLILRKNREYIFEAKPGTVKKPKVFDSQLINWTICSRKDADEKIPNLKSSNPVTFTHYGEKLAITFKKAGFYFIEGYGRIVDSYKYDKNSSKNCVFLIEVADKNKITGIDVKGAEPPVGDTYVTQRGTRLNCMVKLYFPLEDDEKDLLVAEVFNTADGTCVDCFSGNTSFIFHAKNEACYEIAVSLGEEKKKIYIEAVSDDVIDITPPIALLRPNDTVNFQPVLKYNNNNVELSRVEWHVNDLRRFTGSPYSYYASHNGKKKLEAFIPPAWLNVIIKGKRFGKREFEVKKCDILKLERRDEKGINSGIVYIGKSATINAFTNFSDYSIEKDGKIDWFVCIHPEGKSDGDKNLDIDAEKDKRLYDMKSGDYLKTFSTGKTLFLYPYCPGIYTLKATMNGRSHSLTLHVMKGEILRWCFTDKNNNHRTKGGWKQDFYITAHIKGWENRPVKVNLFLDKMDTGLTDDKRHIFLDIKELKDEKTIDTNGVLTPILVSQTSDLWQLLEKQEYKRNAQLYFTISRISIPCKNQHKEIYHSGHRYHHIFPDKSQGDIGRYLQVVNKRSYNGFFADPDNGKLKRIIRYGEPAKALLYIMQGRSDYTEDDSMEYAFSLIENLKKADKVRINKEKLPLPDSEGLMSIDIDTINKSIKADEHKSTAGHEFQPRVFYFELYQKKTNEKDFGTEPIYVYPEGYNDVSWHQKKEEKNDDFIVDLHHDIPVGEEYQEKINNYTDNNNEKLLKNRQDYFSQLKIAKDTTLNRTLRTLSPVIIGEALDKRKKKKPCICKEYKLIYGSKVSCDFRQKVIKICKELWPADYLKMANGLMVVMGVETGYTFKAHRIEGKKLKTNASEVTMKDFYKEVDDLDVKGKRKYNPDGSVKKKRSSRAVGLIQFTQGPLTDFEEFKKGQGYDKLDAVKLKFARMGEIAQLDYVEKYFRLGDAYKKITVPEDIYSKVFAPSAVGKNDDFPMYKSGTTNYAENKSLDTKDGDNDGIIQKREMLKRYHDSYDSGMKCVNISYCEKGYEDENKGNTTGWHDPVDNPQINKYSYGGYPHPWKAVFGWGRGRFHTGTDIFGIPEVAKVYASLDSKLITNKDLGGNSGYTIILEIIDTNQLIDQKNKINYQLLYSDNDEWEASNGKTKTSKTTFNLEKSDTVRFTYCHLDYSQIVLTKKKIKEINDNGGIIKAGTHIAYVGVTGNADGTKAPHLHLTTKTTSGRYLNPAFFVNFQSPNNKEQDDAKKVWNKKGKDKNNLS